MIAQPLTPVCEKNLVAKSHVCFGVSPFNSYFTETKIEELARWGKKEFQSMHFFIPDVPSIYTLEAQGYEPEKAAWKARRQSQYVINKISKALKNVGICFSQMDKMILNWESLSNRDQFQLRHIEIQSTFEEDPEFQKACLEATEWVLEGKLPHGSIITEQQSRLAVKYLLAEIPIFLYSPEILEVSSSVFCYHQCVPFIKNLISGHFSCQKHPDQGFAIIKPQTETHFAAAETFQLQV